MGSGKERKKKDSLANPGFPKQSVGLEEFSGLALWRLVPYKKGEVVFSRGNVILRTKGWTNRKFMSQPMRST